MPSPTDLVRLVLTVHVVLITLVRLVFAWRARKVGPREPHGEGVSAWLIAVGVVGGYGAVAAAWGVPDTWLPTDRTFLPGVFTAGVLVLGWQAVLLFRAHDDLGTAWSGGLALTQEHRLVTEGTYARVRHPMYGAALLWPVGALLVAPVPLVLPLAALAVGVVLRVRHEERMLEARFGDEWRAYAARTRRFF
jgi:protein-S-isoprenylcysteine O-methyltransferase Ste14